MALIYALIGTMWGVGWALACVIDITVARWPESAAARAAVPPTAVRWLILFLLWPLALRAVLAPRRRTR